MVYFGVFKNKIKNKSKLKTENPIKAVSFTTFISRRYGAIISLLLLSLFSFKLTILNWCLVFKTAVFLFNFNQLVSNGHIAHHIGHLTDFPS